MDKFKEYIVSGTYRVKGSSSFTPPSRFTKALRAYSEEDAEDRALHHYRDQDREDVRVEQISESLGAPALRIVQIQERPRSPRRKEGR